jgi:hypothetical protein
MSLYDIVFTLFSAMFGKLFNLGQPDAPIPGPGTQFTCTLQGYFIQWGFGSFAYGAWLSVFYVLTIRYNMKEALLARYLEPVIHSSVFCIYFGTALAASILGWMNPSELAACGIMPYPLACAVYDTIPCLRGAHYRAAALWMILVPSCLSVAVILACLGLVAWTVWQQRQIVQQQRARLADTGRTMSATAAASSPVSIPDASSILVDRAVNAPLAPAPFNLRASIVSAFRPNAKTTVAPAFHQSTSEAVVQCVISGCTFVNSVLWTNVALGFFVTFENDHRDLYWVRERLVVFGTASCTIAPY